MSMAHGVESRLPFMDYRLVEFAFQLADTMKLNDGYTKLSCTRRCRISFPRSIVQDRRKRRFARAILRLVSSSMASHDRGPVSPG